MSDSAGRPRSYRRRQEPMRENSEQDQNAGGNIGREQDGQQTGSSPAIQRANPLGDILGALLGGGQGNAPSSSGQSGIDLGDLIGSLLGGQQQPPGPQPAAQNPLGSLVGPLVRPLAQKLGIPENIAQAVVIFVLTRLLAARTGQGAAPQAPGQPPSAGASALDQLLQQARSGQPVDTQDVQRAGLATELSQETGLDQEKAAQSIQEVLSMLGQQSRGIPGQAR